MKTDHTSSDFKKLLDKLQQESWQLELIISGFAIFGLFSAIEPINLKGELASHSNMGFAFIWTIAIMAVYILLFNLVLHVLLRGLWIGAIGLRYVSGDIDYEKLNYSPKFTNYLKNKVGSFDRYIATLENYCSVMFAISFLLVFYVIGGILSITIIGFIIRLLGDFITEISKPWRYLVLIFPVIIIFSTIVVFVDFLGQGFLKRKKWTSKIYFPIYRVFTIITLSFLYRPLIYNFLDNKFGKRLSILLVPMYIGIVLISSLDYSNSNYIKKESEASAKYSNTSHYESLNINEDDFIKIASIPSKVIETNYLKVFLLFDDEMENFVMELNDELKREDDSRGYYLEILSSFKRGMDEAAGKKDSTNLDAYLRTFNNLYTLKIDSTTQKSDFIVSTNAKNRLGFETYLSIKKLKEGKHTLTITGPQKENKIDKESKTIQKTILTIPFWYFPSDDVIIKEQQ